MSNVAPALGARDAVIDQSAGTEVFVGRQPIFDRDRRVVAYELLYRTGVTAQAGVLDGDCATARVLVNAFLEIGLEELVGPHRAFVNFTANMLGDGSVLALPPERVTIEVLEDAEVDAALVEAVRSLREKGYRIALDDFVWHERWEPLLELAEVVKVDVPSLSPPELARDVERLRGRGLTLLAEKVETQEQFEALRALGFDLFQGYFFARPNVVGSRRLPANQLAVLRLLAALQDPEIDSLDVEPLISADAGLSYKLLRYMNSPFFGLSRPIDSIRRALAYFGVLPLKRWVSLLALSSVRSATPELLRAGLVRARLCELLAERSGAADPQPFFTTGLLSILDALLDRPMAEILAELPLAPATAAAILDHAGAQGAVLRCACAAERCDWERADTAGVQTRAVHEAWRAAVRWADEAIAAL